jgi:hypothetical protein
MPQTDTSTNITAAVFAAYLKCPTKAYLLAHGEVAADTFVADMRRRISVACEAEWRGGRCAAPFPADSQAREWRALKQLPAFPKLSPNQPGRNS